MTEGFRHFAQDLFACLGIVYFAIGILDYLRWWNGSDENGDPK